MKYFSFILFLLLFVLAGNVRAHENAEWKGKINLKLNSVNSFTLQAADVQEGILDTQDPNEMDGFDGIIIHPAVPTDPLQASTRIKTENDSVFVQVRINSFFIDLPPPLLF